MFAIAYAEQIDSFNKIFFTVVRGQRWKGTLKRRKTKTSPATTTATTSITTVLRLLSTADAAEEKRQSFERLSWSVPRR